MTTVVLADASLFWRVVVHGPLFQNVKHAESWVSLHPIGSFLNAV